MQVITLVPDQYHLEAILARQFRDLPDLSVMQAPPLYVLSQWMISIASRIDLLRGKSIATTPDQYALRNLWDSVIRKSHPEITPQESFSLSAQAINLDRLLSQWGEDSSQPGTKGTGDNFGHWRLLVNAAKKQQGWFTGSDWLSHLADQLSHDDIPPGILPKAITLRGFVELSELEESVFRGLRAQGVDVCEPPFAPDTQTTAIRTGFPDADKEIGAMAQWARQQVADGVKNIAIIYNGLENAASQIQRILENTFEPESVLAHSRSADGFFHIAKGSSLACHPLISDGLLLIRLAMGGRYQKHEFPDISRLLLSDNWAGADAEKFDRAKFELDLRTRGLFNCSLPYVADRATKGKAPGGLRQLRDCINLVTADRAKLAPAAQILVWLKQWGWPGKPESSPETVACYRLFLRLLEAIDHNENSSNSDCYLQLHRLCSETAMPVIGGPLSPVQVLTPEQAFGREFDAAWLANFTMENWPPRPVSNPFMTTAAARRVPRATEDGMLAYTKHLTRGLLKCAPEVRVSWCNRLNDLPVSPSPLISKLETVEAATECEPELWARTSPLAAGINSYKEHQWLQARTETQALPVSVNPETEFHSVIPMLNMQSACPLAAYLVFRLQAKMPSPPGPFTDVSFRGTLVHVALEKLYRKYLRTGEFPAVGEVNAAVSRAFDTKNADQFLIPAVLSAERLLIEGMLTDWLNHEQSLNPGEIFELEWQVTAKIADISFKFQIDRVDRLADGQIVLLDYKTGSAHKTSDWGHQRLREVQLPLYATMLHQSGQLEPAGISFANVRLHDAGTEGLGTEACVNGYGIAGFGHRPARLAKQLGSWQQALETWNEQITSLMREFISGNASHQVFNALGLQYSGLQGLLRNSESTRWRKANENQGQ